MYQDRYWSYTWQPSGWSEVKLVCGCFAGFDTDYGNIYRNANDKLCEQHVKLMKADKTKCCLIPKKLAKHRRWLLATLISEVNTITNAQEILHFDVSPYFVVSAGSLAI